MRALTTLLFSVSLLLPAAAQADIGDTRVVFAVGNPGCAGVSTLYDLNRLALNNDGTSGGAQAWSVPVGAILEITDIEFEAPLNSDRLTHYIQLYVVNRWSPSSRYVAWREAYGNFPLYDLNTQTGTMYESTRHQSDTRRLRGVHFSSGVLINANGKACLSLAQMPSGMEVAQIRVRGQLHPDDDLLFPPVLNGISR